MFDSTEPVPLYLHVYSNGGDIHAGLLGYDKIKNNEIPIHTIVDGYVASAGVYLTIAGEKRYVTRHAYMLIHQLYGGMDGKYKDLMDESFNYKLIEKNDRKLYRKESRGKMTIEQVNKICDNEKLWSAKKIIKYGFAEEYYDN